MKHTSHRAASLIDWNAGIKAAIAMGVLVFIINAVSTTPTDWFGSCTAALKQALYTLLIGGLLIKLACRMSVRTNSAWLDITIATFVAGGLATVLVYCVHSLRGTPNPITTTVLVAFLSCLFVPFLGIKERKLLAINKATDSEQ